MNELKHHGILGMRWGIRRFQNKDGTLTPRGRERLGIDKYEKDHNTDVVVKKGTKVSRGVNTHDYDEILCDKTYKNPEKAAKQYVKDTLAKDEQKDTKYISIDGVKNSGRINGKEFYTGWFTDYGWQPNNAWFNTYTLKNDIKVASGKQVVDTILDEIGSKTVKQMIKEKKTLSSLTYDYTTNKELFDKVNKRLKDKGYDAIEDINDNDSDMPVIIFDSRKNLGKPTKTQSGKEALQEVIKIQEEREKKKK